MFFYVQRYGKTSSCFFMFLCFFIQVSFEQQVVNKQTNKIGDDEETHHSEWDDSYLEWAVLRNA
jgi:hypothetical protein